MKRAICLVATVLGLLGTVSTPAHSHEEYDFIELTENAYLDYAPQINDTGQVVWQGWDGTDYEIWFYDGVTAPRRIETDDSFSDELPRFNNAGQIVWQAWDGHDYEIMLFDPASNIVTRLTDDGDDDLYPNINTYGEVAWVSFDGSTFHIMLRDRTGTTKELYSVADICHYWPTPLINDRGQVVWVAAFENGNYDIFFYPGGNASPLNLTNNAFNDCNPSLNNSGHIVWQSNQQGNFQIFFYDGTNVIQLTTDPSFDHRAPKINDKDQIVWEGSRIGGGMYGIYLYDAGKVQTLVEQALIVGAAQLNASGKVVWQGSVSSYNSEIFLYEGTLPPKQLTNSPYVDRSPQINAVGYIVWIEFEPAEHETEILLARVSPEELMNSLIKHVQSLNLAAGLTNSLVSRVQEAIKALHNLNARDKSAADNILNSFVSTVSGQSGKKIPANDAATLMEEAQRIIQLLTIQENAGNY